jgi:PAS domain S-box-containing protein
MNANVAEAVSQASKLFLSPEQADRNRAIEFLGKSLQAHWAYVLHLQAGGQKIVVSNLWCSPDKTKELENSLQEVEASDFAWSMDMLLRGESIVIPDTDLIPPVAANETNMFKSRGIRSILTIPIRTQSSTISGVMVFCSVGKRCDWPDKDVKAMEVIAELLGIYWEREKAVAELKQSEERFRMIFEYAPDAYYLNDMQGNFVDGNKAAEEIIGYPRSELIGKNVFELNLVPESELSKMAEAAVKNMEGRPAEVNGLTVKRKDGSRRLVDIRAYPVQIGDQPLVLGIARDITERMRAEKERKEIEEKVRQLQKMEAVGRLAGGVAHEINNPLGVILGFAQSVSRRIPDDDPLSMPLKSIEREALRCKALVSDLLAFSRKSAEEFSPVDPSGLLESTRTLVENQARLGRIEMVVHCDPDLPKIHADVIRLQQVLVNMATNAIDAMPCGGLLSLGAQRNGSAVVVTVGDTGEGMSLEVKEHIFEPFFTTKELGKGTGLGLSLAFEIIGQHGGTIECDSQVGKGTTFTIRLPVK